MLKVFVEFFWVLFLPFTAPMNLLDRVPKKIEILSLLFIPLCLAVSTFYIIMPFVAYSVFDHGDPSDLRFVISFSLYVGYLIFCLYFYVNYVRAEKIADRTSVYNWTKDDVAKAFQTTKDTVTALVVIALLVGAGAKVIGDGYEALFKKTCSNYAQIASVGGCDLWGGCKVRYDDGLIGDESKPVVGQFLCRKKVVSASNMFSGLIN